MERAEFQHEQKANVRNSGEGLFKKTDRYTEAKSLLKDKRPLTRVCNVRQSSRTYPTSPSERCADFDKCGSVMQEFCLSEDFEMLQNPCHSESLEKYYELANSYFSCYSESINADEKQIELDRFRIKSGMTLLREMHLYGMPKKLCSCLYGMTVNYLSTEHVDKVSAPLEADFGKSEAESETRPSE